MKNTALDSVHRDLGAKMVPFAGYNMPVQYEGLNVEHKTVREKLGVFDVSHMGEFFVSGPSSIEFLQKVTSNDISKLVDGKVQYSCLPNRDGGIVDDLLIYRMSETEYMLVVNASNIEKDWNWLQSNLIDGVEMKDRSDEYSLLAVQGPLAIEAMQSLTEVPLNEMKYYSFQIAKFAGISDVIISATGYTGSGGFELYVKNDSVEILWNNVLEAGASYGIKPAGLGARDTLRLEKGFCLYGNDINDTTSPIEAGLGWITKFTKDFINSENLKRQKEEGVHRKLIGFEMLERGIPRQHYKIVDENDQEIGEVTSGTQSPSLNKAIGMGYVNIEHAKEGTSFYILIRNKKVKAQWHSIPFLK